MSQEIRTALSELRDAGRTAGYEARDVEDEAAAYAAAICGSGEDAASAWAIAFDRPVATFAAAAACGRPWRDTPTPLLVRLAADHDHGDAAAAYARALVDLAAATATITAPSLERINAAGFAASAQLRAVSKPDSAFGPAAAGSILPLVSELLRPPLPQDPALAGVAPAVGAVAPPATAPAPDGAKPAEPPPTLAQLLATLDGLIGLTAVKDEIHHQAELLRVDQLRKASGLKPADVSRHLVFTGNPGTGKTTVARLVAGIYRALGILEKGQLVETDRSGCVAGYVGQTALKTADVVKSAIGGVLFIDEAYALATDEFGDEAIDTLVKAMEDHRDELVLIVAGYTDEMASFITANPGLESRFRTTIEFADFGDDELVAIFEHLCRDADFTTTDACIERLRVLLRSVPRDRNFGNARYVRNQFEAAVVRQAWRLRDIAAPSVEQLRALAPDDLELDPLTPPVATGAGPLRPDDGPEGPTP